MGKSGMVLQNTLTEVGAKPEDLFITNVVKHRPPNNRDPYNNELEACWKYLAAQIDIVSPKLILCVGKVSATYLAKKAGVQLPATGLRGRRFTYNNIPVHITWHPAYVMDGRTPEKRPEFVQDVRQALYESKTI